LKKLKKEQIQPIIDPMVDLLPSWKADLLTKAGRKVHVQFVLIATIIYLAMALDLPQWVDKQLTKSGRVIFGEGTRRQEGVTVLLHGTLCVDLWTGRGGGGLDISNLKILGWALGSPWLWLKKTEPHRPWASLEVQVLD
jgi:hypothetical protein